MGGLLELEFVTLASTVAVARIASGIYLRAVLRTGASVPLRELIRGAPAETRPVPSLGAPLLLGKAGPTDQAFQVTA